MASGDFKHTRVGAAVVISNNRGQFLFGKRKGSHGAGTWALPGGHIDHGESTFQCAVREVEEETGLKVKAVKPLVVTNDLWETLGRHYITIFVLAELVDPDAKPTIMEPNKCEEWKWMTWEDLGNMRQEDLFLPLRNFLAQESDPALLCSLHDVTEQDKKRVLMGNDRYIEK
ncbi:hypothetical protein QQS21_006619 [Conoideocrella luteorostrata]|uniref:Nudix hydrolase domain-containing protein n=1 Tax=Conoideocrella luteorostrata TaxID=1105319 RepID=A0AAJ0FY37_9HYPO|nr:hypothetical protein QQS21_006619 [Conoideocrella luteorostrata]